MRNILLFNIFIFLVSNIFAVGNGLLSFSSNDPNRALDINSNVAQQTTFIELKIDSIQKLLKLERSTSQSQKANLYLQLVKLYIESEQFDKVSGCFDQAILSIKQSSDSVLLSESLVNYAWFLYDNSDFSKAEHMFVEAKRNAKQSQKNIKIEAMIGLGKVYSKMGKLPESMHQSVLALEIANKNGLKNYVADAWHQIGVVHWKEGKNTEALEAYSKGLRIRLWLNDSAGIAESHNSIGVIYKLNKQFPIAFEHYKIALEIRTKLNLKRGLSQTLFNIGSAKMEVGQINEAIQFYKESYVLKNNLNDNYGKLSCFLNLGDANKILKRYVESRIYYEKGLELSEQIGAKDFIKSFHRELSDLYAKQEDYAKAYRHHVDYLAMKDSLLDEQKHESLAEMQARYNLSEKQRNIDKLTAENVLEQEKNKSEASIRYFLIALFVFISIYVLSILNRARLLRNKNRLLKTQNEVIESKSKENELITKEMHHRVKNNLQLVSGILNLQIRKVDDSNIAQGLIQARDRIYTIGRIHQSLYLTDNISEINLKAYIPELCQSLIESHTGKDSDIVFSHTVEDVFVNVDKAVSIGLIVNEAILNSIKYAFNSEIAPKRITIQISKEPDRIAIKVEDNGVGVLLVNDLKTFGGFGFNLIRLFTQKLSGELFLESKNGTSVIINIPISK